MSNNPALHKAIAAHTEFRGVKHHARGDVIEELLRDNLKFTRMQTGRVSRLPQKLGWRVTVPVVATVADLLPLYQYFQTLPFGRNYGPHPVLVELVTTATDVLTVTAHPFAVQDPVRLMWDETAPTIASGSLSTETVYYVGTTTTNTIKLYLSAANALAGTSPIDFTAVGTGDFWLAREMPLVVHRRTGVKRTYRNAVVEKLPDLVFSGGKLLFEGNLVFRCLPGLGTTPGASDTASFYAEAAAAYVPPVWAGTEALTKPVSAAWGATPPWDSIRCEGGFRASFTPSFEDFDDGVWPGVSLNYKDFAVEVKGKPIGLTIPQYQLAQLADLGVLMTGSDLVLTATGLVLTVKQAIVNPAGTTYSAATGLVQEITWMGDGSGAPDLRAPFTLA